ncbi:MAG: TlpA disulfide reductase family protein [Bacteroidota bacterium]|nr:TlpA disulfide reductase family protein [Bacteroidota bacterium]
MKKLFFLIISVVFIISCTSDPRYTVEGELEGIDEGKVYLQKRRSDQFIKIDSASIEGGTFQINGGSVDYPDAYYLNVEGKGGYLVFFLENTKLNVNGHADSLFNAVVEGSFTQDEYDEYNNGLDPLYERNITLFNEIRNARQQGDTLKLPELEAERNLLFEEITEYNLVYVRSHPASYVAPHVLNSETYDISVEEIESFVELLDPKLLGTEIIIDLKDRIEKLKKVAIGKMAPDFTLNDTLGNPVSLSDVVGPELLLVDFWAAWCDPCRQENPNVVAVYNEFHDKGFDVLGVSLDRDKDDWLKAIEEDSLVWTQVSDLQYWQNKAAQLYAVTAIPANFLLDSEGKIIATNVRGPELRRTVAEKLGE